MKTAIGCVCSGRLRDFVSVQEVLHAKILARSGRDDGASLLIRLIMSHARGEAVHFSSVFDNSTVALCPDLLKLDDHGIIRRFVLLIPDADDQFRVIIGSDVSRVIIGD